MNVLNHLINCENGEIKNVFWKPNIKPILNQINQIECIILHFDDVTEQIINNHKIDKLNNLHLFLSKLNQNILREQNENLLFKNACKFALDYGKFAMAWVGLFDKDEHVINLVEQNGIPDEDLKHFYKVKTEEYGLQKQEIETGKYFVCNHIKEDTEQTARRPFYFKNNILSYLVFPLIKTGKIIGSLNLYSHEKNYFNQEEITLLTEIVNNICFELDNIEKQKKAKRN
jgi:GAF domain-containing protein